MSLVTRHWTPHRMLSWNITQFNAAEALEPQQNPPPYCVQPEVKFASIEDLREALTTASEETGKDVKNYTNVAPAIWVGRGVRSEGDCQGKAKGA